MPEGTSKIPESTWFGKVVAVRGHPTFLQRNINKATARLEQSPSQEHDDRIRLSRLTWKPPIENVIDAIIMSHKTKKDKLKIDITGLKPNRRRASIDSHEPSGSTRKKCRLLDLKCYIDISIFPVNENGQEDIRYWRRVECDLTGRQYSDGEAHFDISLTQPIILSNIDLETDINTNGNWTRGLSAQYRATFTLSFQNAEESKRILSWVGAEGGQLGEPVRLSATWENLIKCPPRGTIIPAQLKTYSKKILPQSKLKYGFEINMAWQNQAVESVLQVHNRAQRRVMAKTQTKTPPLEATRLQSGHANTLELEYRCEDRYFPCSGLHCIICRRQNFSTPANLHFHLRSSHQLSITMTQTPELVRIVFREPPEASEKGSNWSWANISLVAPPISILRKKFLSTSEDEVKKLGSRIKYIKKNISKDPDQMSSEIPPVIQLSTKPKFDVTLELDYSKRKKFKRPSSPGRSDSGKRLRYYTTLAKRPICEGEMLEESDDDVDVEFAVQAANATLKSTEEDEETIIPKDANRFLRVWNRHLTQEHLYSDRYLGFAIVRFIGKEQNLLRSDASMRKCLQLRMKDLLEAGAMSKKNSEACLATLEGTCGKTPDDSVDAPSEQNKVRGQGNCSCGGLYSTKEIDEWAFCSNQDCLHPSYHLKCVGLEDMDCPPGWRCKACMR